MAPKKETTKEQAVETTVTIVVDAPADPEAATALDGASGAIIEPAILDAVDLTHPSIDANPRLGTTAVQNARDMNDPMHRRPDEEDFVGQGLDPSVYGKTAG